MHNMAASFWFGLTNTRFKTVPGNRNTRRYYRQIARLSVGFALFADFALLTLGGTLKRKERLSGLFADALSNLYLCSCVLKHYQDQGCPEDEAPLLHWACQQSIYRVQQSLRAVFWKLPLRPLAWILRGLVFPIGKSYSPPSDLLLHKTALLLLADTPVRDRLTLGIYINSKANDATGRIEVAFKAVLAAAPVEAKIRLAQKQKQLPKGDPFKMLAEALATGIITQDEADLYATAEQAGLAAITVDDFSAEELMGDYLPASSLKTPKLIIR
jgi:acyl-CoA dehydrogenase